MDLTSKPVINGTYMYLHGAICTGHPLFQTHSTLVYGLTVLGMLAAVCNIYIVLRCSCQLSQSGILIISLASADALYSASYIFTDLSETMHPLWVLKQILRSLGMLASVTSLFILAIDHLIHLEASHKSRVPMTYGWLLGRVICPWMVNLTLVTWVATSLGSLIPVMTLWFLWDIMNCSLNMISGIMWYKMSKQSHCRTGNHGMTLKIRHLVDTFILIWSPYQIFTMASYVMVIHIHHGCTLAVIAKIFEVVSLSNAMAKPVILFFPSSSLSRFGTTAMDLL